MDEKEARDIAQRASTLRPMLDIREWMHERPALLVAASIPCGMGGVIWQRTAAMGGAALGWLALAVFLLVIGIVARFVHRTRQRRLDESRERMLCPRCRYTLCDEGPNAWTRCDDTARICPECAFAVRDDTYAAAALPTLREHAERATGTLRRKILNIIIVAGATFLVWSFSMILVQSFFGDVAAIVTTFAMMTGIVVIAYAMIGRMRRDANLRIAAWLHQPYCPTCNALLPEDSMTSPLAICAACDQRVSPPAALAEARRAAIR